MKRFKIVLAFIAIIIFISCDSDMDDISLSNAEVNELNQMVREGEWRISQFSLKGSDQTANFDEYLFVFEDANDLSANSSLDQLTGTWRISNDSGSEFESYNDVDFNIYFSSNGKLGALTRNYDVISATQNEINLNLENGEDGDSVILSFSKN